MYLRETIRENAYTISYCRSTVNTTAVVVGTYI